jgi:hypothetical protein
MRKKHGIAPETCNAVKPMLGYMLGFLVRPSAANPKFAQGFGASNANFGFKGGTRKEAIASVLIDSEVRTSVPQY